MGSKVDPGSPVQGRPLEEMIKALNKSIESLKAINKELYNSNKEKDLVIAEEAEELSALADIVRYWENRDVSTTNVLDKERDNHKETRYLLEEARSSRNKSFIIIDKLMTRSLWQRILNKD